MFCIPIIAKNTQEALDRMALAAPSADVMEIRLDLMESFDIGTIIRSAVKPLLVTYRSDKEGERGIAKPDIVAGYLRSAVQEGADLVDVELTMPHDLRQSIIESRGKTGIVVSSHINDGTPSREELKEILNKSVATGCDIAKIVTMANRWDDNLRLLELIPDARERDIKIIAFCMGHMGRMSRIFSLLMGAHMTFASFEAGQESAPGQITISEMKMMLEYFGAY